MILETNKKTLNILFNDKKDASKVYDKIVELITGKTKFVTTIEKIADVAGKVGDVVSVFAKNSGKVADCIGSVAAVGKTVSEIASKPNGKDN